MKKSSAALTIVLVSAGLGFSAMAQAKRPIDEAGRVVDQAMQYGFASFEEIEYKRFGRSEIEGFLADNDWNAEVTLNEAGEPQRERQSKRTHASASMTPDQVRSALTAARDAGMVTVEEVQIEGDGRVEVDGYDADKRELEVTFDPTSNEVIEVDHD